MARIVPLNVQGDLPGCGANVIQEAVQEKYKLRVAEPRSHSDHELAVKPRSAKRTDVIKSASYEAIREMSWSRIVDESPRPRRRSWVPEVDADAQYLKANATDIEANEEGGLCRVDAVKYILMILALGSMVGLPPLAMTYLLFYEMDKAVAGWAASGLTQKSGHIYDLNSAEVWSHYTLLLFVCPVVCCFTKIWGLLAGLFGTERAKAALVPTLISLAGMGTLQLLYGASEAYTSWHVPRAVLITGIFAWVFIGAAWAFSAMGNAVDFPHFVFLHGFEVMLSNSVLWAYSLWIPLLFFSLNRAWLQVLVRITLHPMTNFCVAFVFRYVGRRMEHVELNHTVIPFAHYCFQMSVWGRFLATNLTDLYWIAGLSAILAVEQTLHVILELYIDHSIYVHLLRMTEEQASIVFSDRSVRLHLDMINVRRVADVASIVVALSVTWVFRFTQNESFDNEFVIEAGAIQFGIAAALPLTMATIAPARETATFRAWRSKRPRLVLYLTAFAVAQAGMFIYFYAPALLENMNK